MFIFSCYTGLAYSDVKNLTQADIIIGIESGKWIRIKRNKMKSLNSIPLLPIAEEIIDRYQEHPEIISGKCILPLLRNQNQMPFSTKLQWGEE